MKQHVKPGTDGARTCDLWITSQTFEPLHVVHVASQRILPLLTFFSLNITLESTRKYQPGAILAP